MKKTLTVIAITMLVFFYSCKQKNEESIKKEYNNNHLIMATLYQQSAAEYKAICYQTFNLAKLQIEADLKNKNITAKRAIITDVDETVLDNSPFEAKCILENTNYPTNWDEWVNKASAKPLPGALEFLNFLKDNNIEVFYITNRKEHLREATLKNLSNLSFPYADNEHLFMRTDNSSKEERRIKVERDYHISLLMGDNLADFIDKYDNASLEQRSKITDNLKNEFGKKFIVLPNPMYGAWESAIFDNNNKLPKEQKDSLRKAHLISF